MEKMNKVSKRDRGSNITREIKKLIIRRSIERKNEPRELVAEDLIEEIGKTRKVPPTVGTLKKMISEARAKSNPLDEPWHVINLMETGNDIPPQILSVILKLNNLCKQTEGRPLTVREVRWGVRLSDLVERNKERGLLKLLNYAVEYAWLDKYIDITGKRDEGEESFIDRNLYIELTRKLSTESVIDKSGREIVGSEEEPLMREPLSREEKIGERKAKFSAKVLARDVVTGKELFSKSIETSKEVK